MSKASKRRRDWFLTVPARTDACSCVAGRHTCAFTKEDLEQALFGLGYTGQMEQGENGYLHFQVFINQKNQIRFDTLRKRFADVSKHGINIEAPRDKLDSQEYCRKSDTRVGSVFTSSYYLEVKDKKADKANLDDLHARVLSGETVDSLVLEQPLTFSAIKALREVEMAYNTKLAKERPIKPLDVHYIYGPPGVGKSYYVYSNVPREDLYVCADKHLFDGYQRERVMLIDEFSTSRISLTELLNVLDAYTPTLTARYYNRIGLYDQVFIISNVGLSCHYRDEPPERFNALLRRITRYSFMKQGGVLVDKQLPKRRTGDQW